MESMLGDLYRGDDLLAMNVTIQVETSIVVAGGRKLLQGRMKMTSGLLVGEQYLFAAKDGRRGTFRVFQVSSPDTAHFTFTAPLEC